MEDKVIEIARFELTAEAEMLADLLKSEGIDCYVRDGISSSTMFGYVDIGGAKVDLLKKDALRALEIMKDYNYEIREDLSGIIKTEEQKQYNTEDNTAIVDDTTESYNACNDNTFTDDEYEDDNAGYSNALSDDRNDDNIAGNYNNKARLSIYMIVIIALMVILFGILVFLNKFYNG